MLFRVSVVRPEGTVVDVDVEARSGDTVADLRPALASVLPGVDGPVGGRGPGLVVSGRALEDGSALGHPPLVDGAVIRLATDPPVETERAARGRGPVHLVVLSGPDAGHEHPLRPGRHPIGRSAAAGVTILDDQLSRVHCVLTVDDSGLDIEDAGSTNGTRVDGVRIGPGRHTLRPEQVIGLGRSRLMVHTPRHRPAATRPVGDGTIAVNRRPRPRPTTDPVTVRLPRQPDEPERTRTPWPALLLPVPAGAVLAVAFGPHMLLLALMSPLLVGANVLGDRFRARRAGRTARRRYAAQLADARERVHRALAEEHESRTWDHPGAAEVLHTAVGPGHRLWERSRGSADRLHVRVGTGSLPSRLVVHHPGDPAVDERPLLHALPVTVDLARVGVLGVSGASGALLGVASHVVGQLATAHSPADLALWFVGTRGGAGWAWTERLPHARRDLGDPGSARWAVCGDEAMRLIAEIVEIVDQREREPSRRGRGPHDRVDHVVVLDRAGDARAVPGIDTVLGRGPAVGVHAIALDTDLGRLPTESGAVLDMTPDGTARLEVDGSPTLRDVVVDRVGDWWTERLSRALAPLRDAAPVDGGPQVPDEVRLVDLLDLDPEDETHVQQRWATTDGRPRAVLGQAADGRYVVDLVADGPHVLIGGTTGSGKSELLQTLVLALALDSGPDEVTFVLVDFKGGAAFAECAGLPHVVGVVTDLDAHLATRALRSLGAELRRRERLLRHAGARDLDDLRARVPPGAEPLPRLVLVVDEFRALAEELPDFLDGLVRIAAAGRSLGIHVVLATQRPGGAVSADVRANINLRIALRVRDRVDSEDVIDAPDAARIDDGTPGRAIVRCGSRTLVTFQAARVGGRASATRDQRLRLRVVGSDAGAERPGGLSAAPDPPAHGPTDLTRLVATLRRAARGTPAPHVPWLPALPPVVPVATLPPPPAGGVAWGLTDRPDRQTREVRVWTPDDGHVGLVGGPTSGRTTAARTLAAQVARSFRPEQVHLYAVDGAGGLAGLAALPHTGAVVPATDASRVGRLLTRLSREVRGRRADLSAHGLGSVSDWLQAEVGDPGLGPAPPYLLLLVDGWEQLGAVDESAATPGRCAELLTLVRDGHAAGLRVVVTGDRSLLVGRLSSLLETRLVLRLTDPNDLTLAGLSRRDMPRQQPAGRAVDAADGSEVQLGVLGEDPSPAGQRRALAELGRRLATERPRGDESPGEDGPAGRRDLGAQRASGDTAHTPFRVEPFPAVVPAGSLPLATSGSRLVLGLGGDEMAPVVHDLEHHGRLLLVVGPSGSGRSTGLAMITLAAARAGQPVAVVGPTGPLLAEVVSSVPGVAVVDEHDAGGLVEARRRHPELVVVVDDADRLLDAPVSSVLQEVVDAVDREGGALAVAATTDRLATQFRGPAVEVARRRTGVLLTPRGFADGDVLGVRTQPTEPGPPGRGLLVRSGRSVEVQLGRPGA